MLRRWVPTGSSRSAAHRPGRWSAGEARRPAGRGARARASALDGRRRSVRPVHRRSARSEPDVRGRTGRARPSCAGPALVRRVPAPSWSSAGADRVCGTISRPHSSARGPTAVVAHGSVIARDRRCQSDSTVVAGSLRGEIASTWCDQILQYHRFVEHLGGCRTMSAIVGASCSAR